MARQEIENVFTPRSASVNNHMYINRTSLEKELYRSIIGTLHSVLFGESGSGKSWLYKKVLDDKHIQSIVANCANASRLGSIVSTIADVIFPDGKFYLNGIKSSSRFEFNAAVVKGTGENCLEFSKLGDDDKLLAIYEELGKRKKKEEKYVIILDNLETILDNENIMKELGNIIILLDDKRYSKYNVKYLLVGIPQEIINYFRKIKNCESIGNRLQEIEKVGSLTIDGINNFVNKGFCESLDIALTQDQIEFVSEYIYFVTLGLAQRLHEYCLQLAYCIQDNSWIFNEDMLEKADEEWLKIGFRQSYAVIEQLLNSKETKMGRRNQVLYCIGKLNTYSFTTKEIEDMIKSRFTDTCDTSNLGVNSILKELSEKKDPIIRRVETQGRYEIVDSRYLLTIRMMMERDVSGKKVLFKSFNF